MTCKHFFKNIYFPSQRVCRSLTDKIPKKLLQNFQEKKIALFLLA